MAPGVNPFGKRLSSCVFGVVGLGRIGTAAVLRAKAFGMDVVMYDPYRENGAELAVGIRRVHRLRNCLANAMWSACTCRWAPTTEKLINLKCCQRRNLAWCW